MENKNVQNIDKLKEVLNRVKYNGDFNDLNDIASWLREKYNLYVWVERDTYWLGYRYVYTFDHPRGNTTGPCESSSYYRTLENGIFDATLKLLSYIEQKYWDYRKIYDEI